MKRAYYRSRLSLMAATHEASMPTELAVALAESDAAGVTYA